MVGYQALRSTSTEGCMTYAESIVDHARYGGSRKRYTTGYAACAGVPAVIQHVPVGVEAMRSGLEVVDGK